MHMINTESNVCIFGSHVSPTVLPPYVAIEIDNGPNGVSFFGHVGETREEAVMHAMESLDLEHSGPVAVVPAPADLPADARTEDVMRIEAEYAKAGFRHVVVVC